MRLRLGSTLPSALTLSVLAAAAGCGGKTPKSGSPTQNPNAPEWVARGSRIQSGSIFGVGFVDGVKNTELARTDAANRARSEVSKILETYSASLMKDFQESVNAGGKASSEAQLVSQAVKTFSQALMTGTEVKEYWLDGPKGTWYALVELNFERSRETAALKAKMGDDMKAWLDQNGGRVLSQLENQGGGPPPHADAQHESPSTSGGSEPPPPPAAPPAAPPPAAKPGPAAVHGGPAPAWTQGRCDIERYLCGVGSNRDQGAADTAGRAELARIFKSNIESVATSFESAARTASSKTGETWTETQQVKQYSMVSTDKVVTMSEILERWDDAKGTFWSLAVIDRAQAGAALRDQIAEQDSAAGSALDQAKGSSDKLAKFRLLRKAAAALAVREALNSDLRVVDRSGKGVPAQHNIGEVTGMLDSAGSALKIGVALSGSGSDRVQACLEEGLTNKGLEVSAKSSEEDDDDPDVDGSFDVLLKGTVKAESKGVIDGAQVVQINLTLKLINGKTKKVLKTFNASKKASRGDVKSSAATAAFQLCSQKMGDIVDGIDQFFGRR
jgi:hypothetical protein